jgi:L-asparaginase
MNDGTVYIVATGGTIASHFNGNEWISLTGADLIGELSGLQVAVQVTDVASGPSSNLSVDDMVKIVAEINAAIDQGALGVVVLHGTDTLELTAFVADLLLGSRTSVPVVFTGSMRVHSHDEPDGPLNIAQSIVLASSPEARDRGVMVCLNGEIHSARRITKIDASTVRAFTSAPFLAVGGFVAETPIFVGPSERMTVETKTLEPAVVLLTAYPGMSPELFDVALGGARGIVLEVFGDLNVPVALWEPIHRASQAGVLVVLASRPYTSTFDDEGLALMGAIGAGGLSPQKARLATMAALGSTPDRESAILFLKSIRDHALEEFE